MGKEWHEFDASLLVELLKLDIPVEPHFTDWQRKRIRYRLLVYLRHLQYPFDNRDKSLTSAQRSKIGEAGRVNRTHPSWKTVANDIQFSPEAEPWVWFEGKKNGPYTRILADEAYKAPVVGKELATTKPKQSTCVTAQKLHLFVIGQKDTSSPNFPRRKFDKTNGYTLKGAVEFLMAQGFLLRRDLTEPSDHAGRDVAAAYFSSLGLEPQELRESEYFNGDYVATKTSSPDKLEQSLIEVHTEIERFKDLGSRQFISPQLYKARLTTLNFPNGADRFPVKIVREGFGIHRSHEFTLFHYVEATKRDRTAYVGPVACMKLGDTIIAKEGTKNTRKIVSVANQVQLFAQSLKQLSQPAKSHTTLTMGEDSEVFELWEKISGNDRKYVFKKSLDINLLFNNIDGMIMEDNNKQEGADKKQKNLSGKFLFRNTQKEAEELGARLSEMKMDHETLIENPEVSHSLGYKRSLELWPKYKDAGFNERLAFAVQYSDVPIAVEAIENGADINYIDPVLKLPMIVIAATCGSYPLVERMLDYDSLNILVKDHDGLSVSEIISWPPLRERVIQEELNQAHAVADTAKLITPLDEPSPYEP